MIWVCEAKPIQHNGKGFWGLSLPAWLDYNRHYFNIHLDAAQLVEGGNSDARPRGIWSSMYQDNPVEV